MDILCERDALTLATRLRRLADRLESDVVRVARGRGLELDARWLPVLWALVRLDAAGPEDLAQTLGVGRRSVLPATSALEQRGWLERQDDPTRGRATLTLTAAGRAALERAEALSAAVRAATEELLEEVGGEIVDGLAALEAALDESPLAARLRRHLRLAPEEVQIVGYRPAYRRHFERLNREWIETLFEMEPEDEKLLTDPNGQIIRRGGEILFALVDGQVVGTAALLDLGPGHLRLAKMAVASAWRGLGIGRRLAEAALERARARGAEHVTLLTNPHLREAMVLYLSLGFTAKTDQHGAEQMARPSLVMELRFDRSR